MRGTARLAVTPRDRFFEAAQEELIAFEGREREFRKKDFEERALQLQICAEKERSQIEDTGESNCRFGGIKRAC
jgi:hypothetical protein